MTPTLLFAGGLVLIVTASELFTNAVEWAGYRLKLASGATGSLLAALGTSLPETVVPVVALISGEPSAASVATGAVLGSAFLLLGVGTAVTGAAVLLRRSRRRLEPQAGQVRRDLGLFIGGFSVVLVAIILPRPLRICSSRTPSTCAPPWPAALPRRRRPSRCTWFAGATASRHRG